MRFGHKNVLQTKVATVPNIRFLTTMAAMTEDVLNGMFATIGYNH